MPKRKKTRKRPWTPPKQKKKRKIEKSFYDSKAWTSTRDQYLLEHPFCQCKKCDEREASGMRRLVADMVDHVIPIEIGGSPLDERNLQAMNNMSCHQRKRGKERHGYVEPYVKVSTGLIPRRIRA